VDPLRKGPLLKVLNYICLALLLTGIMLFETKINAAIYIYFLFAIVYLVTLILSFFSIRK
jgi:hypothetical protein